MLVELTGNAADPTVDPSNAIPDAIRVDGMSKINLSIPGSGGHGRGYVVYGVAPPQGTLSLMSVSSVLAGATLSWCVLMAFSRLYLGVHYASDVVAGVFAGAAWVAACASAFEVVRQRRTTSAKT